MKILFCKVAWMKDYQGITEDDKPFNGGDYVKTTGKAHEEYNFKSVDFDENELMINCDDKKYGFYLAGKYYLGFFEPKSTNKEKVNQIRIENINGCELCKSEPYINDVLVIWCATAIQGGIRVVGWYNHATVYRYLQESQLSKLTGREYFRNNIKCFNAIAETKNCVLLPHTNRNPWIVPLAKKRNYGFGQSMVWYATETSAKQYIEELVEGINNYKP